ncbi:MAG TPA: hypothetical protein VIG33_00500, partial [Pseudobdellovibrionaceae bacterium]
MKPHNTAANGKIMQKIPVVPLLKSILLMGGTAVFGAYALGSLLQSEKPVAHKIIDMHTHVACLGSAHKSDGECYISPEMQKSFKFSIYLKSFGVSVDELKRTENLAVFDRLIEKIQSSKR